jgi:hypothetical protein
MPTVLRVGRFRFFFYSNEGSEPPHIHVQAGEQQAKFWLDPIELVANYGFRGSELREVQTIIVAYHQAILEAWNDFFGDT